MSKDPAAAVPSHNLEIYKRTSNCLAVYPVELYVIVMASEWVERHKPGKVLVCSDSMSALASLMSNTQQDLLLKIMYSRAVLMLSPPLLDAAGKGQTQWEKWTRKERQGKRGGWYRAEGG